MKPSRTEFIDANGLRLCVRHWGNEDASKLFMVHGWMDIAASFQFVVDAFKQDWHVIAPDVRGFGHSGWAEGDYWLSDYLADLEAVLDYYSPDEPVKLVGHSLGGKITTVYAGIRPHRIEKLISMEGYGIAENQPDMVPGRLERWLDAKKKPKRLRPYRNRQAVVNKLMANNPRLTLERAEFLADYWAEQTETGEWKFLADPKHKLVPSLTRLDEILACWSRITAPVMFVEGEFSWMGIRKRNPEGAQEEIIRRASRIPQLEYVVVKDSGHMMQHDQPEQVAAYIERFMDCHPEGTAREG